MTSWSMVHSAVPDLATAARQLFDAHEYKVMATIRADGSPRVSGTEIVFAGGELWLAGMAGARRWDDLRRDPRVAVHSGSDEPDTWTGDAKLSATVVEVTDADALDLVLATTGPPPGPFVLFRIDITELVVVAFTPERSHITVSSWRPGQAISVVHRG